MYFKKGQTFDFANWQTPALIDTVSYKVVESDANSVKFQMNATIENYSGKMFVIGIDRKISMLSKENMIALLDLHSLDGVKAVGYQSVNSVTNEDEEWKPETGMLRYLAAGHVPAIRPYDHYRALCQSIVRKAIDHR